MSNTIKPADQYLYFDIETAGMYPTYQDFLTNDPHGAEVFATKYKGKLDAKNYSWKEDINQCYVEKCGLLSAFGQIVCVSFAVIDNEEIKVKSFIGTEEEIMEKSVRMIKDMCHGKRQFGLGGFNIDNFDVPWLRNKVVKYGMDLPYVLNTFGKKPWESNSLDLFKLWNGVEYVSLNELCLELGIPSPKDEMKGSDVHGAFYAGRSEEIARYCEKDTITCVKAAQKILRFTNFK